VKKLLKTLRSELAVVGLLLLLLVFTISFLLGMKKNFLMSKSKSDVFDVVSVAGNVGASTSFESVTAVGVGVGDVVVVKKKASRSPSDGDEPGGLGALNYKRFPT
jgi:hypothetical protein